MTLSTPRAFSRAARATALQQTREIRGQPCFGTDCLGVWGSGGLEVWTYAFPPPIMNTSVSISGESSSFLPGDRSKDSSSGCKSRSSSFVLRIQIFHWIASLSSLVTGKSKALPLHVAAGELVLKLSEQSMNC